MVAAIRAEDEKMGTCGDPAGMLERGEDLRTWVQDALTGTPAEERGEARVPPISVEEGDWIS